MPLADPIQRGYRGRRTVADWSRVARGLLALIVLLSIASTQASSPEPIVVNDNRVSAGTMRGGVLTIRLEAREGEWHPDADAGLGVVTRAFAVEGGAPRIPGPLIRVVVGTEIHASVRNALGGPRLVLHGLNTRGASGAADTVSVAAGETREIRFMASRPGTFYYWGTTEGVGALENRTGFDRELSGAIVVDPANAPPSSDRIFLINGWTGIVRVGTDTQGVGRIVINGKSWPHTERLAYAVGDTVRFRMINASGTNHPMHLHGFYYNVDSRGNEQSDSVYGPTSSPHLVNTERLAVGRTYSLTWVPTRAGNWLFHCHDPAHIQSVPGLDGSPRRDDADLHSDHLLEMMSGPVMGISVRDAPGAKPIAEPAARRALRLTVHDDSGSTARSPSYGYTLGSPDTRAHPHSAGPVLVLQRGEPVSITVVNRLSEPTSVHWHGIELESYYDGVAGFAGQDGHLAPQIAPNDSFIARFTPPRSGTFMYHPHVGEVRQQQAGLGGALIVVDDVKAFDPATDLVFLVSTSRALGNVVYLNGSATPPARELHVGVTYRLRLLNLHNSRPSMIMKIMRDSTPLTWRAIAKDGMNLPADQATVRPSVQQMGNGEIYDFEFVPTAPGMLRFDVTSAVDRLLVSMPLRVVPPK